MSQTFQTAQQSYLISSIDLIECNKFLQKIHSKIKIACELGLFTIKVYDENKEMTYYVKTFLTSLGYKIDCHSTDMYDIIWK